MRTAQPESKATSMKQKLLLRRAATLYAVLTLSSLAASAFAQEKPRPQRLFRRKHIHTSWSVDAWLMGNRVTGPDDALKYAQGQTIKHPLGYDITIDTPMDFMGVTDHSEYVGVTKEANTPGSAVSKMPEAQPLIIHGSKIIRPRSKPPSYICSLSPANHRSRPS